MFKIHSHKAALATLVTICVMAVSVASMPLQLNAWSPLQSALPAQNTPMPNNPSFVFSTIGGRRVCGSEGSPVFLEFANGFTSAGGAAVVCDPNPRPNYEDIKLLNANLFGKALSNRGYLIGIYPSVSFAKPLTVIFEVDSARMSKLCKTCVKVKHFNKTKKAWTDLPTTIDLPRSRITAKIDQVLPGSDYPGFPDRMLIALFLS